MPRIPLLGAATLLAVAFAFSSLTGARARAGTAVQLDLAGIVDASELALEARVLDTDVELDARGRPCTRLVLSVERDLLGATRGPFDVRLPGGILPDGSGLLLAGMPRVLPGEEVVLFLSEESNAGLRVPVGLAQGKFRIERDAHGARTVVRDGAELELFDVASGAAGPALLDARWDYAEFMAEVQAAVAHRRAAPRAGSEDK